MPANVRVGYSLWWPWAGSTRLGIALPTAEAGHSWARSFPKTEHWPYCKGWLFPSPWPPCFHCCLPATSSLFRASPEMREKSNTTVLHVSTIHAERYGPRTAEVHGVLTLLTLWLKTTIGYLSLTVLRIDYTLSGSFPLGSDVSWHCSHMKDLPGWLSR